MDGYVKLWRKSFDSHVWANPNLWRFWTWCLMKATFKQRIAKVGFQDVYLEPGQFIFGRRKAAIETGLSERKIRTAVDWLKTRQKVTIKTTQRFSVISIVNWSKYQEEATQQTTNKRPTNDQQTTTDKKGKKDKKEKKGIYTPLFIKFWESYPRKEAKVKALSAFNEAIKERTNGHTEETFTDILIEAVVRAKQYTWKEPQFIPHPTTWLNGKRWEDERPQIKPSYKELT